MKTHFLSFAMLYGLISGGGAEDATKPLVSMTVKRQTLDASNDKGSKSESSEKQITLRIEIKNVTNETLEGAVLTGEVMINRSKNDEEKMVIETLKSLKLPPMKPNEKITVDLGKVILNKVRWKKRTFEESLEEWKVVCKKGDASIGESLSDNNYTGLVKEMEKQEEVNKEERKQKGLFRKICGLNLVSERRGAVRISLKLSTTDRFENEPLPSEKRAVVGNFLFVGMMG